MGQLIEKRVAFLQVLGGKKKSNTKRVGIPKGNHPAAGKNSEGENPKNAKGMK
jgi:hypothetical protein